MTQKPQEADLEKVKSLLRRLDDRPEADPPAPGAIRQESRFPKLVQSDVAASPAPLPPPPSPLKPEPPKVEAPAPATTAPATAATTSAPPASRLVLAGVVALGIGAALALAWSYRRPMPIAASQASLASSDGSRKATAARSVASTEKTADDRGRADAAVKEVLLAAAAAQPAPAPASSAATPSSPGSPETLPAPVSRQPPETEPPRTPTAPPAISAGSSAVASPGVSGQPAEAKTAALIDRPADSPEQRTATSPAATAARTPPPVLPDAVIHDEALLRRLIAQGQEILEQGHVMSARLLFRRAADSGSAEAALLLGDTFDPDRLRSLGVRGLAGDIEQSIKWYEKADELGATAAKARLSALAGR